MAKKRYNKNVRKVIKLSEKFCKAMRALQNMTHHKQRRAVLQASDNFIRDFSNAIQQLRKIPANKFHISPSVRKYVYRRRKTVRKFANPKTSMKTKRKMITQKGGLLAALPMLINILKHVL